MSDRLESPLDLFRAGSDYIQIAERLGNKEYDVEKAIDRLRHAERLADRQAAAQIKHDVLKALQRKARDARNRAALAEIRRQHA